MNDGLTESKKTRLGAAVFLIGLLAGTGFALCRYVEPVRPFLIHVTIGLTLLGLLLLLVRWLRHLKDNTEDSVLHFYWNPAFWGTCLLLAATMTFVSVRLTDPPRPEVVRARVDLVTPPPTVEFPLVTVGGVTLNGPRSTVVIGKEVLALGESYEGVRIIKIFEDGILVEKEGEQRIYYRNTTRPVLATDGDVICHHNRH